ncbi:MAG: prepilin peptidase [bacterium]
MWIPEPFVLVLVLLIGLAAGSFANVCILRIPAERSIVRPGSHCFSCDRAILWRDNVPLLSFLLLRGRCRWCGAQISFRYPLVEALTCAAFVGIYLRFGSTLPTIVYCLLTLDLVVASGIDWDHMWIPSFLTSPGMGIGLVLAFCIWCFDLPGDWVVDHPVDAIIGGCVGGGLILLIRILGGWYYKQEAMGMGDVHLMAFLGTFLGWQQSLAAIFLAALIGALFGGTARLLGHKLIKIPFGPYLALGAYICILYGRQIIYWYLLGPSPI